VCVLPASLFVSVCVLAYLMHYCALGVALPPLCCSWPPWPPAMELVFSVFGWASVFPPLFSSPSPHLHSLFGSDCRPLTFRVERTSCPRNTPVSHHTRTFIICILSLCDFKQLSRFVYMPPHIKRGPKQRQNNRAHKRGRWSRLILRHSWKWCYRLLTLMVFFVVFCHAWCFNGTGHGLMSLHCMKKGNMNIPPNISFYILQKKVQIFNRFYTYAHKDCIYLIKKIQ